MHNTTAGKYEFIFGAVHCAVAKHASALVREAQVRSRIREIHGEMGFDLLLDEHRYVERGGERILFAGVQNWGKGFRQTGDLDAALKGLIINQ